VQLVIADTGPVNYLLLIGHIDILPALFQRIVIPAAVRDELKSRKARRSSSNNGSAIRPRGPRYTKGRLYMIK
jgi:predicted nucleic acid-binding protein